MTDNEPRMIKVMALAVFSRCDELDPDAAADALRKAGYTVQRLPPELSAQMLDLDEFIEAHIEAPIDGRDDNTIIDAIWSEVDAIVNRYGGEVAEGGRIGPEHVPFVEHFGPCGGEPPEPPTYF
jgi:hypothetical protein